MAGRSRPHSAIRVSRLVWPDGPLQRRAIPGREIDCDMRRCLIPRPAPRTAARREKPLSSVDLPRTGRAPPSWPAMRVRICPRALQSSRAAPTRRALQGSPPPPDRRRPGAYPLTDAPLDVWPRVPRFGWVVRRACRFPLDAIR